MDANDDRRCDITHSPAVMAIVNLTADSFYAPSRAATAEDAIDRVRLAFAQGADIVDLGAAASHPGASAVSAEEEIARLAPVLVQLADVSTKLSVDSFQPAVQRFAARQGVGYLNDIHGFGDPATYPVLAGFDARLVVMHATQQSGPADRLGALTAETAVDAILRFFDQRLGHLVQHGIDRDRLILDPGMGFFLSPEPEASLAVLAQLGRIKAEFALPLLVSVSRKSFLRATTGLPPEALGAASLAAELEASARGADIIRTHAPGDLRSALRVREAISDHTLP